MKKTTATLPGALTARLAGPVRSITAQLLHPRLGRTSRVEVSTDSKAKMAALAVIGIWKANAGKEQRRTGNSGGNTQRNASRLLVSPPSLFVSSNLSLIAIMLLSVLPPNAHMTGRTLRNYRVRVQLPAQTSVFQATRGTSTRSKNSLQGEHLPKRRGPADLQNRHTHNICKTEPTYQAMVGTSPLHCGETAQRSQTRLQGRSVISTKKLKSHLSSAPNFPLCRVRPKGKQHQDHVCKRSGRVSKKASRNFATNRDRSLQVYSVCYNIILN
mmetsp:Transcript_7048/g.13326  ORF Transcript_7048/g.13326 Transcript_7048/m.13326 type:complete len:271 (-) Transcript_7048:22-834(-)